MMKIFILARRFFHMGTLVKDVTLDKVFQHIKYFSISAYILVLEYIYFEYES